MAESLSSNRVQTASGSCHLGAVALLASDVFVGEGNVAEQLSVALGTVFGDTFEGERPPVLGFGAAAKYSIYLAYQDWVKPHPPVLECRRWPDLQDLDSLSQKYLTRYSCRQACHGCSISRSWPFLS